MGKMKDEGNRRLWKAVLVLVSISLGLSLVQLALTLGEHEEAEAGEGPSLSAAGEALLQGSSVEEALAAQGLSPIGEAEVPQWVADEVVDASLVAGGYANDAWSVIGVTREGAPDELFDELMAGLIARGWTAHESGMGNVATLTKGEGGATWAMLQCTAVGGSTTAVLQLSR